MNYRLRKLTCSIATAIAMMAVSSGALACWEAIGARYGVNHYLLASIAKTESNFNANAVRRNANGSRDVGVMQINSIHFPELAKYGITEAHLFDPCTNIAVGAWLLRQRQLTYGNTWEAVGTYHSKTPKFKWRYANQVQGNLMRLAPPAQ